MKTTNIRNVLLVIYLSLLIPNILSFLLVLISPHLPYNGTVLSFTYVLLYLSIIGLVFYFFSRFVNHRSGVVYYDFSAFVNKNTIYIFFGIVLIGILLHLYDKVVIRDYDYFSESIRSIREKWLHDGASREGAVSSWQSAFGYIFTFLSFIVFHLLIIYDFKIKKTYTFIILFLTALVMLILSYTIGARSVALFTLAFLLSLYILLFIYNRYKAKLNMLIPIFLSYSLYILFITYQQIYGNGADKNFNLYMSCYNKELNVITAKECDGNSSVFSKVFSLASLYANHGAYNFEYTLYQKEHPGSVVFSSIQGVLTKLNVLKEKETKPRSYGKGMITAFGAIWYDFGTAGFVAFAFFHALLFIFVGMGLTSTHILLNLLSQLVFVNLIILNILSPLTLATNLMIAPALIFSYIILYMIFYINTKIKHSSGSNHA